MLCRLGTLHPTFDRRFTTLLHHLSLNVMLLGWGALLRALHLNHIALLGHRRVLRVLDGRRFLYPALD